ncbi:3-phenylpropionate/trans-cinnamate dioxygenase ferredoxin subunit [Alkalispirochaeta americana]|uniref:3-phenylpropionate/trans-cinnamate dioxygenase ferredoxin subunit n=1 Tax=Alkalispirochaeta americana TaxID=159291 RepID=A0A1N6NFU3_9SPIO|nr:non-heme iron oxygenase ferredoxin subunit [Alkalispirochaeta americana]SIP90867.1 3-phenylpropionate/trans-cinnamate dioxygenase ferredoxin subunit [Alkalispirochaeta americana]
MAQWREVCREESFRKATSFTHRRKEIALFKLDDGVHAIANSCSHEYSPLCEGMVVGTHVYCPKHGSRFDITTGAVLDLPATSPVKTYPVKVEDGVVYVKV